MRNWGGFNMRSESHLFIFIASKANCQRKFKKNKMIQSEIKDDDIINQENQILADIKSSQLAIGPRESPESLIVNYIESETLNDQNFWLLGISDINKRYKHIRRVRGDGNCFYRAFLFAYLEELLFRLKSDDNEQREGGKREVDRMMNVMKISKDDLVNLGYSEFVFETFLDVS